MSLFVLSSLDCFVLLGLFGFLLYRRRRHLQFHLIFALSQILSLLFLLLSIPPLDLCDPRESRLRLVVVVFVPVLQLIVAQMSVLLVVGTSACLPDLHLWVDLDLEPDLSLPIICSCCCAILSVDGEIGGGICASRGVGRDIDRVGAPIAGIDVVPSSCCPCAKLQL